MKKIRVCITNPQHVGIMIREEDVRQFHTTVELSKFRYESFERPLRDSSIGYLAKLGPAGEKLVRELFEIDGIVSVTVSIYMVEIGKDAAFEWDEVQSSVLETLKASVAEIAEVSLEEVEVVDKRDSKEISESDESSSES